MIERLREATGNPAAEFREGQIEAIQALADDRARLLLVQRTGWGKSLVYFLATQALRRQGAGPTLLISPLLALMRNQVSAAARLGVKARRIDSSNTDDWARIEESLLADDVDVLLVSPERLGADKFRQRVLEVIAPRVGLLVVDEAHCISDWGHDFRPDYRRIVRVLQALPPGLPVLATTATANKRVVEDVRAQLGDAVRLIRGPLGRESLRLQTVELPSESARMAWLADRLPELPGSGVIYCLTIRHAERIAEWLVSRGIDAHAYHGALDNGRREDLEQALLDNRHKALVATSALGMGFDKPDLAFVIHFQRPGSVVHYYQQIGRAGRATDSAPAVLLSGAGDQEITDWFITNAFAPEAHVQAVLDELEASDDGATTRALEARLNLKRGDIARVLKQASLDSPAPLVKEGTRWFRTAAPWAPDHDRIEQLTALRRGEQQRMVEYMTHPGCLMQFLVRELDDDQPPCGRCANCQGAAILPTDPDPATLTLALDFMRRLDLELPGRKAWASDALTAAWGWRGRIAAGLRAEPGRALCLWGDPGWGDLVRSGRAAGGPFDPALVQALADLVAERWKPDPAPTWVAAVPSVRAPELVAELGRGVADRLGLPFVTGALRKIVDTPPQKTMRNSWWQAKNLGGSLEADDESLQSGPVLLIDDLVDSGWTLTVCAALLRQAGAGPVHPLVLADASRT